MKNYILLFLVFLVWNSQMAMGRNEIPLNPKRKSWQNQNITEDDGPEFYYTFDGLNVVNMGTESADSNTDGMIINGANHISLVEGVSGNGFEFDGTEGSYIQFYDGLNAVLEGNFTIDFYVKMDPNDSFHRSIFSKRNKCNGAKIFDVRGSAANNISTIYKEEADGDYWHFNKEYQNRNCYNWIRYTLIKNGTTIKNYINGVELEPEEGSTENGVIDMSDGGYLAIGNSPCIYEEEIEVEPFKGIFDELRIYKRALSESELAAIKNPITLITGISTNNIIIDQDCNSFLAEEGYDTYEWKDEGGNILSTDQNLTFYDNSNYTLKITYGGCYDEKTVNSSLETETVYLPNPTYSLTSVLSASAVTYSDTWLLEHQDLTLFNENPYINGQQGIWKAKSSYAYEKDRLGQKDMGKLTNMATAGSFDLDYFNWDKKMQGSTSHWLKASTATHYSPDGYEVENKDILNRYSSAIYGYNGQLATAVAANAKYKEIGYLSFEESSFGNLVVDNTLQNYYEEFEITGAKNGKAIINAKVALLNSLSEVTVLLRSLETNHEEIVKKVTISCATPHNDPEKSVVIFDNFEFSDVGIWQGSMVYKKNTPSTAALVSNEEAHTGKKSLKINTDMSFTQDYLDLIPGKKYTISAWVSKGESTLMEPTLGENVGISVGFSGGSGTGAFIVPTGAIIEGWQRVEGVFTMSEDQDTHVSLTFQPGTAGTVYFDDIRLFPYDGNLQSYVYDPETYRLQAVLDNNNFATLYYYDYEGTLYLVKKETAGGIKSIQESISHQNPISGQ